MYRWRPAGQPHATMSPSHVPRSRSETPHVTLMAISMMLLIITSNARLHSPSVKSITGRHSRTATLGQSVSQCPGVLRCMVLCYAVSPVRQGCHNVRRNEAKSDSRTQCHAENTAAWRGHKTKLTTIHNLVSETLTDRFKYIIY